MKTKFIGTLQERRNEIARTFKDAQYWTKKLSEHPAIQYLQERYDFEMDVFAGVYQATEFRIPKEDISPDVVCSIAGELEADFNCKCKMTQEITSRRLRWSFYLDVGMWQADGTMFYIEARNPSGRWVEHERKTHSYTNSSTVGHVVCD